MTLGPKPPETLVEVILANRRVAVPVIGDEENTRRLAEIVNERLRTVEADSDRVDTQIFALKTALYLAADLDQIEDDRAEENRQLVKALSAVADALRELAEELEVDAD